MMLWIGVGLGLALLFSMGLCIGYNWGYSSGAKDSDTTAAMWKSLYDMTITRLVEASGVKPAGGK